jgi:hypothetical protein
MQPLMEHILSSGTLDIINASHNLHELLKFNIMD